MTVAETSMPRNRAWLTLRPPSSAWIALAVFVVFALLVPRFATLGNIENVLRVAAILCIVACGQAIVLILGGIEFSFGSSAALASVVTVLVLPWAGPLGAFATGAGVVVAVGIVNGFLIARFEQPPFLVTLGMLMIGAGLATTLAGGLSLDAPTSTIFSWPARGRIFGVSVPIIGAALSLVCLYLLLAHSRLGRHWYLVGANANAARLSGIKVRATIFSAYVVAGCFCALTAVILTSRVASGQPSLAPNMPFETIAACAIGGIPLAGGQGRASQVLCGVLIIAMMNNAVVLLNFPVAYQQLMIAVVIVGAVLVQNLAHVAHLFRRRGRP
jgi:ribose/xylose/arabinose/galactoside ABC-type transport system permease subunit